MCGFTGFIDFKNDGNIGILKEMANTLIHRGPDDSGLEILDSDIFKIGLGFRRLSIIDLSPLGHQPMFSNDKKVVVMLNGEIYNFKEIKLDLQKLGYNFISGSDTEVVIASYIYFGISAIQNFIGMFAITIVDLNLNKVFLVRDRAGVKPLFYFLKNDVIVFGSELKALHKHPKFEKEINPDAVALFFSNGNIPAPYSIYKNCCKIVPGEYLEVDLKTKTTSTKKYWDAFDVYNTKKEQFSYNEALEKTEEILDSAFKYRMVADVPIGVFLSGGYDSTAVAALLSKNFGKINTYTIGFKDKKYDESTYAKRVAEHLGTNHFEMICDIDNAQQIVQDLPYYYDEPFGDSSAIPTILVSKEARKHVTVALSADAGDELFAGYPRHKKSLKYIQKLNNIPKPFKDVASSLLKLMPRTDISKADRFDKLQTILKSKNDINAFDIINCTYTKSEIDQLVNKQHQHLLTEFDNGQLLNKDLSTLNKILAIEYKTYLVDDILQKVDRATMSVGLEGREPFLDHRILELVASFDDSFKLNDGVGKRILKDIVHRYVPKDLMERPKMGFGVPIQSWLKNELIDLFEEVLSDKVINQQGILNANLVRKLKEDYLSNKLEDFERLWFVFVFLQWYKKWHQ